MPVIAFFVPGPPVGKARTRSVPLMRNGKPIIGKGGRPIVTNYTPEKTVSYEGLVAHTGKEAMEGRPLLECALAMSVCVFLQIPASTSNKHRKMMLAGEMFPTKKPDSSNVLKAIEDGLNGVVYRDDVQIVDVRCSKRYAATPGVSVGIWPIEEAVLPAMPRVVEWAQQTELPLPGVKVEKAAETCGAPWL